MKRYTYTVEIEPGEDGYFVASVPALPGCFTQGKTFDEAVAMIEDAIRGYLQILREKGESIPREARAARSKLKVLVSSPLVA